MSEDPGSARQRRHDPLRRWIVLSIVTLASIFLVGYLRSPLRWWYEDDPLQYSAARTISNPIDIFTNPKILRGFGTGASLVPMQLLSYWLDVRLFGISPRAAYWHSLISTLAAAILLFLLLTGLTEKVAGAGLATMIWLALPSTISVHSYLATRHYMEGLVWTLAACLLLEHVDGDPAPRHRHLKQIVLLSCALAAMLSKELYVVVLPAWIAGRALWRRSYGLAICTGSLIAAYASYRFLLLGTDRSYPVGSVRLAEYFRYLARLPFTLFAGYGGYLYYGLLVGFVIMMALRRPPPTLHA